MKHYISKDALVAEINRLEKVNQEYKKTWKCKFKWFYRTIIGRLEVLEGLKAFVNTLEVKEETELSHSEVTKISNQEEPVSEELEEASKYYALNNTPWDDCKDEMQDSFKAGAKWQETKDESTTEDLGEYINELSKQFPEVSFAKLSRIAVRVAKWQKEKEYTCYEEAFEDGAKWNVENLWKSADGDDLPEIDREVIVLIQPYPLENSEYAVSFAHRPNPNGWDGKSITTGKVEHYTPKTYDKGGWNIPDVKFWLDVELPKEIEL